MNYFSMAITIFSHIAASLYMERAKYNKLVTAGFWFVYAIFSIGIIQLQENELYGFFSVLIAQAIIFFITSDGPAGEKVFLFLTYANSFCICLGANLFLSTFLEGSANLPICTAGIFLLMHIFLYKILIPVYKKAKVFFQSGWLKLNVILSFFFIQFLNQYAFTIVDRQSASDSFFDFVFFSLIFYSTLIFIFSSVKDTAEMNRKIIENDELKNMAYIDTLTNMQNRAAYMKFTKKQILNHRANKNIHFLSVVMDIDGFKSINDIKGHAEGDKILKYVSDVICEQFEPFKCETFRVGGDEFVLLTEHMKISDIEKQMKLMNEKLLRKTGTTVSYGCSEVNFNSVKPFDTAFKKADEIMYSNKQQKKVCN